MALALTAQLPQETRNFGSLIIPICPLPPNSVRITIQPFTVHKRFALTISRGTTAQTTNVWVRVEQDGIEGWGEASPFSTGDRPQTTEGLVAALEHLTPLLQPFSPLDRQVIHSEILLDAGIPSAAEAALDMALWDWVGKRAGLPLWQLWGFDLGRIPPTSATIGISSPEAGRERVRNWLQVAEVDVFKVKLGSPSGLESDRALFEAVQDEAMLDGRTPNFMVDANGGWTVQEALQMADWLADRGVLYLEQPLPRGQEHDLKQLHDRSPLPIFVDESCWTSFDLPTLADRVSGINIKLMKCRGLTEALRMLHTARALGLDTMVGCYSDSSLANTAAAHLSPLLEHVDLDSHLNLVDDPFHGATLRSGRLLPNSLPGLGVERADS
ncbi:MAG: dipeptide epimerase [Leptolyngbyaceae cyanobacterium bins.59]|nr:dipeptide epimerase [Leptolyngbyaceae cyanobacterium bins.59]